MLEDFSRFPFSWIFLLSSRYSFYKWGEATGEKSFTFPPFLHSQLHLQSSLYSQCAMRGLILSSLVNNCWILDRSRVVSYPQYPAPLRSLQLLLFESSSSHSHIEFRSLDYLNLARQLLVSVLVSKLLLLLHFCRLLLLYFVSLLVFE